MSHDSLVPLPCFEDRRTGFHLEVAEARLACRDVRGFDEALTASRDPIADAPPRLVLIDAAVEDERTMAWLDAWAEDAEHVRRSMVIVRARDGACVAIVATLASHGLGVPTSLLVESVRAREGGEILRSGVHLATDVDRAFTFDEPSDAHELV